MVVHRRAGKTVACIADLVLGALRAHAHGKQDARYAYIAPLFNQAKDAAWLYVKRLTSDIPGITYNEAELRANFPNGAQVRLFGADNPDRLRGIYLDGVILDEHADMRPRVWGEVVRPMLADRNGWAAFIGTPRGHNEFYDLWQDAAEDPEWFKMMLRGSESQLLPQAEFAAMRKSMTEDQYEQEVECSFSAALLGAYFGREMVQAEREGRITAVAYDEAVPVHTAWDLGFRDDTAIWWYQVVRGEIHVIDYHASSGRKISDYIQLVCSKPYSYGVHWFPADAKAGTLASDGKSSIEQFAAGLDWKKLAIVPTLEVHDGIQAARKALEITWFDKQRCAEGLEALRQYQKEWDEEKKAFKEKPRHDWTSHPADAYRMLAVAWRAEEPKRKQHEQVRSLGVGKINTYTMNDAWKDAQKPSERI